MTRIPVPGAGGRANEPQEALKNVTSATLRAVAGRPGLVVSYTPGGAALIGGQARLPLPPRKLDPGQITRLRGTADSLALKLRHHDITIQAGLEPTGIEAREVFSALEQARYETLGAGRMAGVAANIAGAVEERLAGEGYDKATDPGQIPLGEAVRLLALERFGKVAPGPVTRHVLDLARQVLPESAQAALERMIAEVGDQKRFARSTRELLDEMGLEDFDPTQADRSDDETRSGESEPEAGEGAEDSPPEGISSPGPESDMQMAPGEGESGEGEEEGSAQQATLPGEGGEDPAGEGDPSRRRNSVDEDDDVDRYKVFSRTHDQVVGALDLCDPEELTRLRAQLDMQLSPLQGVVTRIANRLQRRLMAQQTRSWEFDLEEGLLDVSRLARMVANPTYTLSYKQEKEMEFRDTVVSLLIDNSGSMRGRPISVAAVSADILARTLERCGVKVEILGFTTSAWKGGKAREDWVAAGKPPLPGRLNDLRHIIYKEADVPWRRARRALGLMLKEGILKENIDGEALLWAHSRLVGRPEARRILMVISDGAPVDDSTLSANTGNYLEKHLREVIALIQDRSPAQLVAIGIGHDVTRYYQRAVTINDPEDLGGTMMRQLLELFEEPSAPNRRWRKADRLAL
ncbi:cobaltochelatase CobT-related protein [Rhodospirillum rubrum]|uniref:Cobalt chelatase, CobT subunit n=1 Tax=Rhodospirillum rubrum (strain ATCC 11170 / ATH 1.1.1 / DSM 467 / LMG 4362 / NCIMB 8255 / S1) TaxID=269796 RepID=Q2RXY3_RHORT|nr:cobalt chelatase [Rhodospirillum rubrum]ABC21012.1 Cobalt chelatase, CobT subunit [Rhodospirillum rubrum ATCC 11170]AEO46677.1 cobalt chelatase, pCobT subunit [Rhodospirillum rubrum F11]MBK5952554.1 cobaltochelatase subunit CobT [Rhodospirillum rubrum]QXG80708.1 cobaltochelatase subunit CobT [Rhodospirillum rubrum]